MEFSGLSFKIHVGEKEYTKEQDYQTGRKTRRALWQKPKKKLQKGIISTEKRMTTALNN